MKRVKFGIPGLDKALHGGLEEGSATLISGGPGTGKTSMGLHFIYNGAMDGKSGLYVSLEEKRDKILKTTENLGLKKFNSLIKSGKITLMGMKEFQGVDADARIAHEVYEYAKKNKIKRIVVDTLTTLAIYTTSPRWKITATHPTPELMLYQPSKANVKQFLVNFINTLNKVDSTMLFLSEDNDEFTLTQKYICDSVIEMERPALEVTQEGSVLLRVLKTRRSPHSPAVHVVDIKTGKGVSVLPAAEALKV